MTAAARLLALAAALALTGASYGDTLRSARRAAGADRMAAAVLSRGQLVWHGAAGRDAKAGDVYSLASLSKTYTATMVLQLAAAGRLALEDPIGTWLHGLIPAAADDVTVRELLDHTSGLPDYLDAASLQDAFADPRHHWTEGELLRAVRAPHRRGTFSYSNTNYILLGAILRRVTGQGADRVLAAGVLGPLGLRSTSMARVARLARRVAGHRRLPNDVWDPLWTDGAVVASATDVGRFLSALVIEDRLLPAPWVQRMLGAPGADYGLGVYPATIRGATYYGHDGSYGGWDSYALSSPETGLTFVALSHNGSGSGPDRAIRSLARVAAARSRQALTRVPALGP